MGNKIGNEVYVKHFGKELKIEDVFLIEDKEARYVYKISYQGTTYILKGFKIQVGYINPEDRRSVETFEQNLMQMSKVYQEYYFARAASLINPHVAKPLSLNSIVESAKDRAPFSYLHVQIIFEYGGVALNKLQPTTIGQTYNLMRQSINTLVFLHNVGIAYFDIKPANMVYDAKEDLLKIIDMESASDGSNRKTLAATTANLERKVTSATPEFAPPEVLLMKKDSTKELNLMLSLPAIDAYSWAMSFFVLLTNRKDSTLVKDYEKYKMGTEKDYEGFMKIVEAGLNSIKTVDSKEEQLKKCIKCLLSEALEYNPKGRSKIKGLKYEMKKFERRKKYRIKYSQTEIEHDRRIINMHMLSKEEDEIVEVKDEEEIKEEDKMVKLDCGHEVNKDHLIHYALNLFTKKKLYEYCCWCETCKKVKKLKSFPLSCGCTQIVFKKKVKFNNDLTEIDYGKCDKDHPLIPIDSGLMSDFISIRFTSLLISDYSKKKEELVNSFNEVAKEETINDIVWMLRSTKAITKLSLEYKNIGVESTNIISNILKANTTLTQLDISKNSIQIEGAKAIGEALKVNKTLQILTLNFNEIECEGAKAIANGLKINKALKELTAWSNSIKIEGARAIGAALKVNIGLQRLSLNFNPIECEGAKAIADAVKTNKVLTRLNISENSIQVEGGKIIGEALKVNTTLQILDLSRNTIRCEGTKAIANALKTNRALTKLNISGNEIKSEGMKTISEALKVNKTLTSLSLDNNNIEEEDAKIIGNALKINRGLSLLYIKNNNIKDNAVKAISEGLKVNLTLTALYLCGNNIEDEGVKAIGGALKVNTKLKKLDLSGNKLEGKGKDLVMELEKKYKHITIFY